MTGQKRRCFRTAPAAWNSAARSAVFAGGPLSREPVRRVPRGRTAPGLLETIHRHITRTSTVTDNGDLNPYAVIVAPVSAGKIQQGDVLVDNFNNLSNLQGTGTTIVDYNPATRRTSLVAKLPQNLAQCPGGVGLTTAMTMLKSGWIIVGSTPSTDGTTRTKGDGCLLVLDANGQARRDLGRAEHQRPVGQHGGDRQRGDRDAVRQHGRVRRSRSRGARSEDRLSGDRQQGDGAAARTFDSRRASRR